MTQRNGKITLIHGMEELILLNVPTAESDVHIHCDLCDGIFHRD